MKYNLIHVMKWFNQHGLAPVAEYAFHPKRKWRFDFAWPDDRVALEVEGGIWTGGGHTRGSGYLKDLDKYNSAAVAGWRVLKTTPSELCMPETVEMVKAALHGVEVTEV